MESTIIKYLVIVALVASISAYVTHKITVDSYAADQLKVQTSQIKAKDGIEQKINVVEKQQAAVVVQQQQIKEVVRIKYQDVIKTNTVYVDKACALPVDGVNLLDSTANSLNNTRK